MLELKKLAVTYGQHHALKGVDLHVAPGEIVVILGANGAGKTSLLKAVAGMIASDAGSQVRMDGQLLTGQPPHRIVEAGLALVPEGRGIFGDLSVRENLLLGAFAQRARAAQQVNLDRVLGLFPKLAERSRQQARTMSGGEQQMVAIGRALMSAPTILMLDEPSLGLSPLLCTELFRNLAEVRKTGVGILLVEQNARQSLAIADRAYLLENGEIIGQGPADQLARDPAVQAAYLGGAAAKVVPGALQVAPVPAAVPAAPAMTISAVPMPLLPTPPPSSARSPSAEALIPMRIADLVQAATQVQAAQLVTTRQATPVLRDAQRSAGATVAAEGLAAALARIEEAAARARAPAASPVPAPEPAIEHHRFHLEDDATLPTLEVYRRPSIQIYRRSKDGTLVKGN